MGGAGLGGPPRRPRPGKGNDRRGEKKQEQGDGGAIYTQYRRTESPKKLEDAILRFYGEDIAFVASEREASDLHGFVNQLDTAADRFEMAWVNGHEDMRTAAAFLEEARVAEKQADRERFLRRADELLDPVISDMTEEYRTLVA